MKIVESNQVVNHHLLQNGEVGGQTTGGGLTDLGFRHGITSPNYVLLRENALKMRNNPTEAERFLWNVLRGNRLGYKFRRQHIVGDYIADFACISKGLIIEIDGGYHNNEAQQESDLQRTEYLNQRGFKVLRFTNEQVLNTLDNVINSIKNELQ